MTESSDFSKHVDESWKKQAQKEKEELSRSGDQQEEVKPSFFDIVGMYTMQTVFFLGLIKDPNNPNMDPHVDLKAARLNIEILNILQDKTKGNLTAEETTYMTNTLNELRMLYIQKSGGDSADGSSGSKIITP